MATKIFKRLNDSSIKESWSPVLESYGANLQSRPWLADYAHHHAIFDNSGTGFLNESSVAPGLFLQQPGSISSIGSIYAPTSSQTPFTGAGTSSYAKGATTTTASGSGDKFPSLLPIAIQVAAKTIGFDLVDVIPMDSPVGFLPYLDYVYQGGNIGTQYDPFMVKLPVAVNASLAIGKYIKDAGTYSDFLFQYVGTSRVDGLPIIKVVTGSDNSSYTVGAAISAIAQTALGANPGTGASAYGGFGAGSAIAATDVQLVSALENHISGFTSLSDTDWAATDGTGDLHGPYLSSTSGLEPTSMTREVAEVSKFRQMGLRMFTKFIQAKGDQVAISATVEQIQDLNRVWNYDVMSMLENVAVNELAQSINKKLVDRCFKLGDIHSTEITNVEGAGITNLDLTVGSTGFENISTLQRRVVTKILEMANLIYHRGRFGAGTHIVTNGRVASALADVSGCSFAPFNNDLPSGVGQLYPAGKVHGLTVYVDPNLKFSDNRIHIARKGADEEPGLKFLPYIMAESLQTIAEGTFSPKIGMKSRYAITEAGWHPETQYITLGVTGLGVLTGSTRPSASY